VCECDALSSQRHPWNERAQVYIYIYMMHACIYIHARLATPTNGSPMRARRTHAPTCSARARARVRVRLGGRASAPTHASALGRRGPRVARHAVVLLGVGVQREHRRVEHRACVEHGLCMRRPFPARAARHRRRDALGRVFDAARAVVRGGDRRCARACASVPNLGAHTFAPARASAFRRRGPRVARRAVVLLGVGVQRGHRRVEHRACDLVVRGMRRLSGEAARLRRQMRSAGSSVRRGPLCAAAPPMRARVCARRRVRTRMRGCARM
jgi:hypothetical protein